MECRTRIVHSRRWVRERCRRGFLSRCYRGRLTGSAARSWVCRCSRRRSTAGVSWPCMCYRRRWRARGSRCAGAGWCYTLGSMGIPWCAILFWLWELRELTFFFLNSCPRLRWGWSWYVNYNVSRSPLVLISESVEYLPGSRRLPVVSHFIIS